MFIVRSLTHGRMYGVLQVVSERRALAVMVGSMGLEAWGEDCMSRLLAEAVGGLEDALGNDAPVRLAAALRSRLSVNGEPPDRPPWLLYAAALWHPAAVEVCHIGDLRIQLVREAAVVHSTIDHTLGNQGLPEEDAPSHPLRNVVVRSLDHGDAMPERATWPVEGPARLVIASSEVHGHGSREQPVAWPGEAFSASYQAGAMIELAILR